VKIFNNNKNTVKKPAPLKNSWLYFPCDEFGKSSFYTFEVEYLKKVSPVIESGD
jgi:hypothetical protein